jgi:hypothetical protein
MPEYVWVDPDIIIVVNDTATEDEEEEEEEEVISDDEIVYGEEEVVNWVETCEWDEDLLYSCTNCTTDDTGAELCDEYIDTSVIYYQKKLYNLYRNTTTCHYMMDRSSKVEWTTIFLNMRY